MAFTDSRSVKHEILAGQFSLLFISFHRVERFRIRFLVSFEVLVVGKGLFQSFDWSMIKIMEYLYPLERIVMVLMAKYFSLG